MATTSSTTSVADGVHRVADGLVNLYLLEEGGRVTIVDAGWPRSWPVLESAVTGLGRSLADVEAVVLTHAHPDHLGAAEEARRRLGVPVHVARREVDRAKGTAKNASPFTLVPGLLPHLWRPSALGFVLHATARGFMLPTWLKEVTPFDAGDTLDVPGHPVVVATPGHTEGHVSFHLPGSGVVFAGDALCTLDPLTRATGPRLLPASLNVDLAQASASLANLEPLAADLVLPGHGDPWRRSAAEAIQRVREAGAT